MGRKGYHTKQFNHDYFIVGVGAWYKLKKNKLTVRLDFDDIFNNQRYCVYNATETSTFFTSLNCRFSSIYERVCNYFHTFVVKY